MMLQKCLSAEENFRPTFSSEADSEDYDCDRVKPVTLAPVTSGSYPVIQQSAKLLDTDMVPTVTVCDSEVRQDGKKFIVYKLVLNSGPHTWTLYRRYNEFHSLYISMKKFFPGAQLKLPGKRLFGNFEPLFIKHRKDGLTAFVKHIIESPDMYSHEDVKRFFGITTERTNSVLLTKCDSSEIISNKEEKRGSIVSYLGQTENDRCRPEHFNFLKMIGKGSFGKVLLAKHIVEDKLYAVKVLNKSHIIRKNETRHIMSERNVLAMNNEHPFLVALNYSFQTSDKLFFVLDYVNGGELFHHLQKERSFSEARSQFYTAEISSALGYLHANGIIYRDLKPENILLDSCGHIVLTDFGLCKEGLKAYDTTSTFCGTPEYLAPEVLRKEPYDKTIDWWCLGCVLYEMLFGLPPYYSLDKNVMYDGILNKPLRFKSRRQISAPARRLLEQTLDKQPGQRLGAKYDFREIKKHAFFSSMNWTALLKKEIEPPFDPSVENKMDLKHFDPAFVKEPIPNSLNSENVSSLNCNTDLFKGFSYVIDHTLHDKNPSV